MSQHRSLGAMTRIPHGALNFSGPSGLPTLSNIEWKTASGEALTACETFVLNHQPQVDAETWRCELQAVIDECGGLL